MTIAWVSVALVLLVVFVRKAARARPFGPGDIRHLHRFSEKMHRNDFFPFD